MKASKKIVSVILVFVMLICSISLVDFSQVRAIETEEDSITENTEVNTTENESEEYIYYSDLFYGYSYYLINNYPFLSHRSESLEVTTNIINEYITTPNFYEAVISQGISVATDPTSIAKYFSDNIGLSGFKFNDELDKANQKFVSAVCDVNLSASKNVGKDNKYVKNINSFLKMCAELEKTAAENEAYYNGLEKPELYKTFVDMSFEYLKDYCTQISPKLPGLSSQIYTVLCESTHILGVLSDALEFTQALALSILMQETQMDLINEIMATQSSSSTLYKGMNRLKSQLSNGFVSYFADTYIKNKVYDKVIGYLPELLSKGILGNWASYGSVVTTVVKILNKAVFDWILDADYTEYTSAVMLTKYRDDLYESLINKAEVFNVQFNNSEIENFETIYNAYISVNTAAFEECKNLAEHNSDYDEVYCEDVSNRFDKENAYGEFVDGVKEYILVITPENRVITDYGTWEVTYETAFLRNSSDTIESDTLYFVNHNFYGNIDYVRYYEWAAVLYGTITIPKGEKLVINGNFTLLADGHAYLENYGELTVNGCLSYSYNASFLNTGIVSINNTGETALQIPTENNGKMIINGNCYDIRENSGELRVYGNASLWNNSGSIDVSGDVSIGVLSYDRVNDGSLNVGKKLTVAGRLSNNGKITADSAYIEAQSCIYNNNILTVRNDIDFDVAQGWYGLYYGAISMNKEDAVFELGGNFNGLSSNCSLLNDGTLMLNGEKQQQLSYLNAKNIIVNNVEGIRYLTGITVTGEYLLNGNPLDNNGYTTWIENGLLFDQHSDYKSISIPHDQYFYLTKSIKANITVTGVTGEAMSFIVPDDCDVVIDGDLYCSTGADFINNGNCIIKGSLTMDGATKYGPYYDYIYNYGNLTVEQDIIMETASGNGAKFIQSENGTVTFGGNIDLGSSSSIDGTIIFASSKKQIVPTLYASTIILTNESVDGVVFSSNVAANILFDHRGNNFTLFNNGTGSTFVDYDGDGMKDNVDPEPTVGNPCVLYFESEDSEKGTVSLTEVETVGGTKITVMATPTSKYDFSKWENSAGETVSTSAEYTLVAKGDDTYTAVFTKRQQPITVETEGGQVKVPASAEIESEVSINITESAGYVFTVGSLKYNGNAIENGKFIMPDEPVVITAEFIRNENYFNLKEKLDEAKAYTYNDYSKESFAALTAAIKNAQDSLVNNILEEKSIEQITALQNAINNLQNKYITEIKFNNTPVLYYGVQEMINDISLSVIYDNGTKETITASQCSVSDYDSLLLGSQNITITYAEFTQTLEVTTQPRLISDCDVAGLTDKVFDGIKDDYTQELILTYSRTSDILVEGIDYRISYTDNSEIGTATVILEGIGNYSGKKILPFDIYCEHDFVLDYTVDSTCSEKGRSVYKCNICSGTQFFEYVVTENLPESDHSYSNYYDKSYDFSYDGADKLGLLFSTKTYTENGFDKIYIYDSENTLIGTYSGSQLSGKTVVVDGSKVRIRLTSDHSYSAYGFSLDSITAYFSYISLPLAEHEFSDWSTTQEATCTTTGEQIRSCINCETEEYQIIDIKEHTESEEQTENLITATCEKNGSYDSVIYCIECNEELSRDTKEITASGHKEETIPAINPSCTEIGLTEGKKCSICNKILLEQTPIELKGHDYNAVVTVPTCTEQGYTTYTCECGDSYVADYVKENGHSHEAVVTTPATHLTEGVLTYTCTCGDTYTEAIAKITDHTYNTAITVPTCTEQGYTTYTCACGDSYVDDFTEIVDHKDNDGDEFCDHCDEFIGSKDDENKCSHICHKTGIMGFFAKIAIFFWRLFGINPVCECGMAHY